MRAALDWALGADPELGLRIAVALEMYWVSNLFEGVRRLEALLARADDAPPVLRARAWRALGGCLNPIGEQERAERAYHRSLALFREIGSEEGAAIVLFRIGATAANMRDPERARPILEESLEQVRAVGNRMVEGQVLGCLGSVAHLEGDLAAARPLLAESASIAESGGFSWWQGNMLSELAEVSLELGDLVEAEHPGSRLAVALPWRRLQTGRRLRAGAPGPPRRRARRARARGSAVGRDRSRRGTEPNWRVGD